MSLTDIDQLVTDQVLRQDQWAVELKD
jgi:hypothetical protein